MLPSLSLVERVVSPPGQEDHQTLIPPAVIRPIMVMAVPLTVMVTPPRSRTTTNRQANPVSQPKSRNRNQSPLPIRGFRNTSEAAILGMVRLSTFRRKKLFLYQAEHPNPSSVASPIAQTNRSAMPYSEDSNQISS